MAELKPCPFCGDKSDLIQTTCLNNGCVLYHVYHYSLRCPTNGIRTENRPTAEEAIDAWNRRAEDGK